MHLDHLSSSHLEPFPMGRLHSAIQAGLPVFLCVPKEGLARHHLPLQQLLPHFPESVRKSFLFSQAAGQSVTDICINFQVSCPFSTWREWIWAHLLPWWTDRVPVETDPGCAMEQSPTSSTWSHSKAGFLCDPTTVGLTAALLHFFSLLLHAAFDIRAAKKWKESKIADCFKISFVQEVFQIKILLKGDC